MGNSKSKPSKDNTENLSESTQKYLERPAKDEPVKYFDGEKSSYSSIEVHNFMPEDTAGHLSESAQKYLERPGKDEPAKYFDGEKSSYSSIEVHNFMPEDIAGHLSESAQKYLERPGKDEPAKYFDGEKSSDSRFEVHNFMPEDTAGHLSESAQKYLERPGKDEPAKYFDGEKSSNSSIEAHSYTSEYSAGNLKNSLQQSSGEPSNHGTANFSDEERHFESSSKSHTSYAEVSARKKGVGTGSEEPSNLKPTKVSEGKKHSSDEVYTNASKDHSSNDAKPSADYVRGKETTHIEKTKTGRTPTLKFHILCPKDEHDVDVELILYTDYFTEKKIKIQEKYNYDKFTEYQYSIEQSLPGAYTVKFKNTNSSFASMVEQKGKDVMKQYHIFFESWFGFDYNKKRRLGAAVEIFTNKILNKIIKLPLNEVWSIKKIVDDITHIFQCLDNVNIYKKEFAIIFIENVMTNLNKDLENDKKFFLAYLVVEVCARMKVPVKEEWCILCQNLLLPTKDPHTWKDMFKKYFEKSSQNGEKMVELCKICVKKNDPTWLYCIPLIHFLYADIQPSQKSHFDFQKKEWWGTKHIQNIIDLFVKSPIKENILPILKKLKELYSVDALLPQSLVAALPANKLHEGMNSKLLTVDACLGRMLHELKNDNNEKNYVTSMRMISNMSTSISPNEERSIIQCQKILMQHLKIANTKKFIEIIPNILEVWFKTMPQNEKHNNEAITEVVSGLEKSRIALTEFFKICNKLFTTCSDENYWKEKIKETVQKKIKQESPKNVFDAFLEVHANVGQDMTHILCEYSINRMDELEKYGPMYTELLSEIFSHNWPKTKNEKHLIQFILYWTSFKDFVIYYEKNPTGLSESCQEDIAFGIKTFKNFIKDFQTGEIDVLMFDAALKTEKRVIDLVAMIDPKVEIEKLIKDKKHEKSLFIETKELIESLLNIGKHVKMDGCEDLQMKLENNIERCSWKQICDSQDGEPIIIYYEIPPDVMKNLKTIKTLSSSRIFLKILKERENLEVDLSNINHEIIEPTLELWNQYCTELENGSLEFENIDKLFGSEDISTELKMMISADRIPDVQKQIERFKCFKISEEAVDLINEMKDALELEGSFKTIDAALDIAEKNGQINDLDDQVCHELTFLEEYTAERLQCLRTFLKCEPLRMWITKNIADMKALGVFVDLATMSAGEGDYELHKVMCLHSCVIGYGPLIFNLKTESDFETLDSRFKEVWSAFAQDKKLPEKLEYTQRELEWLNTVIYTQGSVEISSITLVQNINKAGVYHIGANDQGIIQDMNSIIRVTILEKNEERQLSFKEITDLQSRLMLVVGKAEQKHKDVKNFSDILDSITHLGKAFLKLYEAGNILCQYMTIICYMSSETPTSILVTFPGMEPMRCEKKCGENIAQQIGNISSFFEKCLSPWTNYIEEIRDKWYELNYYTIQQISFLQKEIATIKKNQNMDCRVYPLLSAVKKYCSHNDVLKAREEAEKTVEENSKREKCIKFENEEPTQKFIDDIIDAGFTIEDAFQALKKFEIEQIDEVIIWLIEKSGSADEEKEEKTDLWSTLSEGITVTGTSKSLIENLEQIWKEFMMVATLDHANIISVEHLGMILHHLSDNFLMERDFSSQLKKGQPNLVVCSQDDILYTTLSIYMESKDQPLPQADEVLYCTKDTTVEQVDIFIKRAMLLHEDKKKIYCMMHADLLNYDASDEVERKLHKYLNNHPDYKLVIICSEENEYKCRIAAALEKFCSPYKCLFQPEEIKSYIEDKFQNEVVPKEINPAYKIDVSHSSVRLIKSSRPGCGKTLYKNTLAAKLKEMNENYKEFSISLYEQEINKDRIMKSILPLTDEPHEKIVRLFHFDISLEVKQGVDHLLFNLLILGQLVDDHGFMWLRQPYDMYLIETLSLIQETPQENSKVRIFLHQILNILPDLTCRTPREALEHYEKECFDEKDQFFHEQKFNSEPFQRTFNHLKTLEENGQFGENPDKSDCLEVILWYCGIDDPTWSQLTYFVKFFNIQLIDLEKSIFCNQTDVFEGFKEFVLKFLLRMSQDFANVTLNLSEESSDTQPNEEFKEITKFQLRRKWETSPHPYLFFNDDRTSITFLGFKIDRETGNLLDTHSGDILEENIMSRNLYDELCFNKAPLDENFDELPRIKMIYRLCHVMEVNEIHDPDPTYELTTDNVKKMLAIYMRCRCDIPVVVMGETGCGKTRLIRFMCQLQVPPNSDIENMVIMKIQGGTTRQDIIDKIEYAIDLSNKNAKTVESLKTILFFDEANTTEAIGMIKDIMCDKIIDGKPFDNVEHLKIVAACNPYRKHSEEMIENLKQAGLGYNIDESVTTDKFGQIPMRHLVYRVKPLPASMLSLVWDFGQLDKETEQLYIIRMVASHNEDDQWDEEMMQAISTILVESQYYMRQQQNECSFVSLRNVERTLQVMKWFSKQSHFHDQNDDQSDEDLNVTTRSLILALSVCYHSSLQNRAEYREHICQFFNDPCDLPEKETQMLHEITKCQDIILSNVQLESTVAKNQALLENVFMMTVCIELRIPLFLVGKPGSSKSLAKTIVANAMQGKRAYTEFFKQMKQAQMISFQCSPLSTTEGILSVFSQGTQFQKDQDLNNFVSVVVLDEIGLAEDSQKMPLKILHPLLEDGCLGNETPEPYKKVAFIGISNWALDPAKMNRGISVQRNSPDIEELVNTAVGICSSKKDVQEDIRKDVLEKMRHIFQPISQAYMKLLDKATKERREFFGLRDFYSMVKMIFAFANEGELTWSHLAYAIKRNFGGLDSIEPLKEFEEHLETIFDVTEKNQQISTCVTDMIETCLNKDAGSEKRYLLLLMDNYTDLNMIKQHILSYKDAVMIFGSSFPHDQFYTKICRNINKIKICMEIGTPVILLNLENLYESLYDALNQFYVYLGGDKFVDLGLGTHRIKCKVNDNFRLIVIAEKEVVYSKFPIPLINRLEKHYLTLNSFLTTDEEELTNQIKDGLRMLIDESEWKTSFVGFTDSSLATIILHICRTMQKNPTEDTTNIIHTVETMLLKIAKPDAIVKMYKNGKSDSRRIAYIYFKQQKHDNIIDFLKYGTEVNTCRTPFTQITTYNKMLSKTDLKEISEDLKVNEKQIVLLNLEAFDTELQFRYHVRNFFESAVHKGHRLIIQCLAVDSCLIANSQNIIQDEFNQVSNQIEDLRINIEVFFIIQLCILEQSGFNGFQVGAWQSFHIDDLHKPPISMPPVITMMEKSFEDLFENSIVQNCEEPSLDVRKLLHECIPAAISYIKDSGGSERAKERINMLNNLLKCEHFSNNLLHIIAASLKSKMFTHDAEDWLLKLIEQENRIKFGGFGNMILQCMKQKIAGHLSDIISAIDINSNLDIPQNCNENELKTKLWINLLKDKKVLKAATFPMNKQEFKVKFPFCWIFFQIIKNIQAHHQKTADGISLVSLVKENSFFKELEKFSCEFLSTEDRNLLLQDYLSDFIRMTHECIHPLHIEILENQLMCAIKQLKLPWDVNNMTTSMVTIHETFAKMAFRFQNFSTMVRLNPQIIDKLPTEKSKEEMTMDVMALDQLLKQLEPKKSQLDNEDGRKQWIQSVLDHFPLIMPILKTEIENNGLYGESCWSFIKGIKSSWTKIITVKLFIHHMNPSKISGINNGIKLCRPLWTMLQNNADMKTIETFKIIETFLKTCNKSAMKQLNNTFHKCSMCGKEMDDESVRLPCQCISCMNCLKINAKCLKCNKPLPEDFEPDFTEINRDAKIKYQAYRDACNGFFMELISQLCFSDGCSPSKEVFDRLMDYILKVNPKSEENRIITKEISISDDAIDQNPILRSFLIQLLMQARRRESDQYLEEYIKRMKTEIGDEESFFKLTIILIIHCMEDDLQRRSTEKGSELHNAIIALQSYIDTQEEMDSLSLSKMRSLASVRFGLDICAKFMYKCFIEKKFPVENEIEQLFRLAEKLCSMENTSSQKVFILKMLVHSYGQQAYQTIIKHCPWVIPYENEDEKVMVASDFFVVWEDDYVTVRNCFAGLKLGCESSLDTITEIFNEQKENTLIITMLAIYKEITCSMLFPEEQRISEMNFNEIRKTCEQYDFLENDIVTNLFENRFGKNSQQLIVKENLNLNDQGLIAMLLHFYVVLKHSDEDHFFKRLLEDPDSLTESFFPAMPEDITSTLSELLKEIVDSGLTDTLNQCPNGHPYFIGDCGRPVTTDKCLTCGENIGGNNYQYSAGNQISDGVDKTKTGYLLGAVNESDTTNIERDMDRTCTTLMKLFLHFSMFLAGNENPMVITEMIEKLDEDTDVFDFLKEHIFNDLKQLTKVLDKNMDDIFLLIHFIIKQMLDKMPDFDASEAFLANKDDRHNWEKKFSETYFKPHILNMENILDKYNTKISEDENNANIIQLSISNTFADISNDTTLDEIENETQLWQYRPHITMEHFKNQLAYITTNEDTRKQLSILNTFFKMDRQLFAVRFIPDIIKLHTILIRKYQHKLGFQQAKESTMQNVLEEIHSVTNKKEISDLVESFIQAWKYVKSDLREFACFDGENRLTEHQEHCDQELSHDSLLAYFIPYTEGPGACSYALLNFLINQHNDFLDQYYEKTEESPRYHSEMSVSEVRQIHVIDFDPDRDFYFLVLPNSNYKFFLYERMIIEYNFMGFQHQLEDRFLSGKAKIKQQQFETIIFRGDIFNIPLFKRLCETIKQMPITKPIKYQISQELKDLSRIHADLENLETVILFLVNNSGDSNFKISEFMSNVLQMRTEFSSNKVNDFCELQHAKSLWLLLNMKIEKLFIPTKLTKAKFENVKDDFKADLTDNEKNMLKEFLKYMGNEALEELISILFEFIFCYLPRTKKLTEHSLKENLDVYFNLEEIDFNIETFPEEIKVKNTVATWTLAVKILDNQEDV